MINYYKNRSLKSLFYINEKGLVCQEKWRDIPEYEGLYQASDLGRIKSLKRIVICKKGTKKPVKERILSPYNVGKGYLGVSLNKKGCYRSFSIQTILAIVFLAHTPCGFKKVVDHKNNNKLDNRVSNLQLITQRENSSKDKKSYKSKSVGVCKRKNSWVSRIYIDGKRISLGSFDSELEASKYYQNALNNYNLGIPIIDNKKEKSSKHKGVCYEASRDRWLVQGYVNGKSKFIGRFKTEEEAYKESLKYFNN